MGVGEIAGLIAAIAFAILAGFMIYPLIRLGKLFDQIAETVKDTGDHAIPALDESVTTVQQVNKSLEDVNKISAAASTTANNVGALTDLYGSFLGKPIIHIIALPLSIVSFGLVALVINWLFMQLASWLALSFFSVGVTIDGFVWSVLGSLVMTIVSGIVGGIIGD